MLTLFLIDWHDDDRYEGSVSIYIIQMISVDLIGWFNNLNELSIMSEKKWSNVRLKTWW